MQYSESAQCNISEEVLLKNEHVTQGVPVAAVSEVQAAGGARAARGQERRG